MKAHAGEYHKKEIKAGVHMNRSEIWSDIKRELYNVWMQETTQPIIKLLGLLLPDLLIKKCSYQTSLYVLQNQIDCKAGTTVEGQNLLANISTSRAGLLQGQHLIQEK